jgi:hypothetical protein
LPHRNLFMVIDKEHSCWGGARQRATPGSWRNQSHQARECGRQFFVIRAFIMI